MNKKVVQEKLKELPKTPGVYIYRNSDKKIIYVGKAVNLKNRVSSYFQNKDHDIKTATLVTKIENLEWIVCDSEIEALILEAELIKRYKPKYNIDWKDDKNYCYIKITDEDYPRISVVHQIIDDKAKYFGPFIDAASVRVTLKTLRRIFPYCTCGLSPDKVCLYRDLGLCRGHGAKYISSKDYKKNVSELVDFLHGKKERVKTVIKKDMEKSAKEKNFEKAAELRNRLFALQRINLKHVLSEEKVIKVDKALSGLQKELNLLGLPKRIECYDISNISGQMAVGSMVVFKNGLPAKDEYRRFEIKTVKGPNDFAMMKEVLKRRFTRVSESKDKSFSEIPNLVIIDGGKGQLSAAEEMIRPLKMPTKVVGLAKREEELFFLEDGEEFDRVLLPETSESRFLIQRIRDEAHRFAITYHRNLRSKAIKKSGLDKIEGVGPKTKKKLINSFGSIDQIKKATQEELERVVNRKLAEKIKEEL